MKGRDLTLSRDDMLDFSRWEFPGILLSTLFMISLKESVEWIALRAQNLLVGTLLILLTTCSRNSGEFEQSFFGAEEALRIAKDSGHTNLLVESPDHAAFKMLGSPNVIEMLSEVEERLGRKIRWRLFVKNQPINDSKEGA